MKEILGLSMSRSVAPNFVVRTLTACLAFGAAHVQESTADAEALVEELLTGGACEGCDLRDEKGRKGGTAMLGLGSALFDVFTGFGAARTPCSGRLHNGTYMHCSI